MSSKISQYWTRTNDRLKVVETTCLLLFGIAVGIATLTYSQNEDMGIFLSETSLIGRGYGVYSQIFEIKDPLFLWLGGLANRLYGLEGPYLLDAVLIAVAPVIAYALARSVGTNKLFASISAVAFTGSLSGVYYQSLRTGTIALVMILVCMLCAVRGHLFSSGVVAAVIVGLKMAYVPILIAVLPLLLLQKKKVYSLARAASGFTAGVGAITLLLVARGEWSGYLSMVRLNFEYREIYPKIVGFTPGIAGHLGTINSYGSNANLLFVSFLMTLVVVVVSSRKRTFLLTTGSFLSLQIGVFLVLLTSAMWIHHLQVLCLVTYSTVLLVGIVVEEQPASSPAMNGAKSFLLILLMLASLSLSGWRIPTRAELPAKYWLRNSWSIPSEIKYLRRVDGTVDKPKKYARLGPNDDLGLAAFLPTEWKLVCREYGQYGHETDEIITQILSCLESKPNYVFVSPGFFTLERAAGNYSYLKAKTATLLERMYICEDIPERPGAKFCTRQSQFFR